MGILSFLRKNSFGDVFAITNIKFINIFAIPASFTTLVFLVDKMEYVEIHLTNLFVLYSELWMHQKLTKEDYTPYFFFY
jgi:hypothetical protein